MSKEDSLAHTIREKTNSATAAENFAVAKAAMMTSAEQAYQTIHYVHTYIICTLLKLMHVCVGEAGLLAGDEDHARAVRAVSASTVPRKEDSRGHSNLQHIQRSRFMVLPFPPFTYIHTLMKSSLFTYIHTYIHIAMHYAMWW